MTTSPDNSAMPPAPPGDADPRAAIGLACRALFPPGAVVELRILGADGREGNVAAGWFSDLDLMAAAALHCERRKPFGIYATINEVNEACLARSPNRLRDRTRQTTSDRDIASRWWLPVDIDPVRPAGISSSDDELAAAKVCAKKIIAWLESPQPDGLGFPVGLRACSGNGFHLLYRVSLQADKDGEAMVADCLAALSQRFSGPAVHVDTGIYNASRILKLWGTLARKGEEIPGRPHRRSSLWKTRGVYPVFDDVTPVPGNALETLAALGRQRSAASPARRRGRKVDPASHGPVQPKFDLDGWIAKHTISVKQIEPWDRTGIRYVLDHCLFDSSHVGTSATLGRTPDGKIFYKCHHETCADKKWHDAKQLYEPLAAAAAKTKVASSADRELPDDPWQLGLMVLSDVYADADVGLVYLRRHRQQWYRYVKAHHRYTPVSDDTIRMGVTKWLGGRVEKTTSRLVGDVLQCVSAIVTAPDIVDLPCISKVDLEDVEPGASADDTRRNWLSLRNRIVDVDRLVAGEPTDDCLMPHTPNWLCTISLPFKFPRGVAEGLCDTWIRCLEEIFVGDAERVAVLQEMFGYCLMPHSKLEKFFILQGTGGNGKSTVLHVLREMLGKDNCTSLTPVQLANRFLVGDINNKLANICGDLKELEGVEEGLLKAIVSGDMITADRKHKAPIQFRPHCKLIFATNTLPRFVDTTRGMWRRMVILPFDATFAEGEADIDLASRLVEEMPGIFLWAIEGAARLMEAKRFAKAERCERELRRHRVDCFPVALFLEECTKPTGQVTARTLYDAYKRWMQTCGLTKGKPMHPFLRDVVNFVPAVRYDRPEGRLMTNAVLYGLSLLPELDEIYGVTGEGRSGGAAGGGGQQEQWWSR